MVDAKTKLLGVIGDPIEHSLSPLMHNFILRKLDLNFCYHAFSVPAQSLGQAIQGLRALNFSGINVTLPHKREIIHHLDKIENEAAQLEAVNTVFFKANKSLGFNTDVTGFKESVLNSGVNLSGEKAILLGAGGSARAVALGLFQLGCEEIVIYNRTLSNAQEMNKFLTKKTGADIFQAKSLADSQIYEDAESCSILVNATSVGMSANILENPLPEDLKFNSETLVFDLIYNPRQTQLLKMAKKQGAKTQNGLDMLIYQGIAALEIWLERKIDFSDFFEEMKNELTEAMRRNG